MLLRIMFTLLIYLCESSVELLNLLKLHEVHFCVLCSASNLRTYLLPFHIYQSTSKPQSLSSALFTCFRINIYLLLKPRNFTSINFEASIIRFNNLFGSIIITIPTTQVVVTIDTNPSTPSRQIHLSQSKKLNHQLRHKSLSPLIPTRRHHRDRFTRIATFDNISFSHI